MRIGQLDGIRAIAILMVIAEHGFSMKMGWAGVDLFFVLSGLLITRILRSGRHEEGYWVSFYVKRATRLLPALVLFWGLSAAIYRLTLREMWPYIFFGANFATAFNGHAVGPLGPLWSLSVEEHFYLVWPLLVFFVGRKGLMRVLVIALMVEPVARGIATLYVHSCWTVYYLTPFRLDGLAAGSLLALLLENDKARAKVASLAGPALCISSASLIAGMALFHSFTRPANSVSFNSIGYSLVTLVAASFVSYVLLHGSVPITRLLSWRPLTGIGVISYGVYLYHLVVLSLVQRIPMFKGNYNTAVVAAFAILLIYCWASFRYFESPWIRIGRKWLSSRKGEDSERLVLA